jgi:hypothetical protein
MADSQAGLSTIGIHFLERRKIGAMLRTVRERFGKFI